jgi:hypothetical protein
VATAEENGLTFRRNLHTSFASIPPGAHGVSQRVASILRQLICATSAPPFASGATDENFCHRSARAAIQ